ncbi:tRNA lysidine(34) synthetase TilS [Marinomonas sp. NPDC078689]|uniref:tRNA lysidine(34) synthetase TilS n=1 Tax=Marinomonas sp. NPDC078689 TaxID=3364147 RepID=UPI0037C66A9A
MTLISIMPAYSSLPPILSTHPLSFHPDWIRALFEGDGLIWVGFSGGVDSHVLLHALATALNAEQKEKLVAIHVHHGLSANAEDWLNHCQAICQGLNVRFVAKRVVLGEQASIEDAARKARYAAFEEELNPADVFLMAHHAGDQAETVLFRLLRGTGGKGLSGIPAVRSLGQATLIRPLLATPKACIVAYAKEHGLYWVEDESNDDERFTRNFIRHRILPTLEIRFPKMEQSIGLTAQRVATDYSMLAEFSAKQLVDWCDAFGGLILQHLTAMPEEKRLFWLRHFLQEKRVSLTHTQLESVAAMVFGEDHKQPEFCFASGRIMRHQGVVYVLPKERPVQLGELISGVPLTRDFDQLLVEGRGCFSLRERPQGATLLLANGHRRKLKKWLNDQKVPSWWREHLPYLYLDDELIAIGSLWRHPSYLDIKFDWRANETLPFPLG